MTPAARISAAITVLDRILAGEAAERALTGWARSSRYAGSKDRAALRDLVFTALRRRRSFAWLGGAETGRGLMLGLLRAEGTDPATLFTGEGHAPAPVGQEAGKPLDEAPSPVRLDCPDWLWPMLTADLGPDREAALTALQSRAEVFLRVNLARCERADAIDTLAQDGIVAVPHPTVRTALQVISGAARIKMSGAMASGLVELQDAASQAAILSLPLQDGLRVLDYCAGGGGKSLAMAALFRLTIVAHDRDPGRMTDLPVRAARSGAQIVMAASADLDRLAPFDLVLADVPCSGSGTWRRTPDAKWRLDRARLDDLQALQGRILDQAAGLVAPGGVLAYATCSILDAENDVQVNAFLARAAGWRRIRTLRLLPGPAQDGFFLASLRKPHPATFG